MIIIGGSNCKKIAYDLSINFKTDYMDAMVSRFADQELRIQLPSHLYQEDVIIVQSTSKPANDNLMELLLLIDAAKHSGSRKIITVIPYFGYSRQDMAYYEWGPISAKLVATMLESSGVDHIITLDLHSKQAESFFKIGVQNIDLSSFFASHIEKSRDIVVVSPDIGSLFRAKKLADILQTNIAVINKIRNRYNFCEMDTIIGDVAGRDCLIIDDIIDTGRTVCNAALMLKKHGATKIRVIATHAVLSDNAVQRITESPIDSILTTNSITQKLEQNKFMVLDITPIIAKEIKTLMRF